MRKFIFLSHALPEDNEFTCWLAGKLTLAGYDVWYDLAYLKGGDYFWNKIEDVIRNKSSVMLAIISESSYKKDGVRNEWELGINIEKEIPGFVIPVSIDGINPTQLPITLLRKNIINFNKGWHRGLQQLIDSLENMRTPCSIDNAFSKAMGHITSLVEEKIKWVGQNEILESNWLSILELPPAIETTQILGDIRHIAITGDNKVIPWFEYSNYIAGFAPQTELIETLRHNVMLN